MTPNLYLYKAEYSGVLDEGLFEPELIIATDIRDAANQIPGHFQSLAEIGRLDMITDRAVELLEAVLQKEKQCH